MKQIDYFEQFDSIPTAVEAVLNKYADEEYKAESVANYHQILDALKPLGFTCDLDADFGLIDLNRMPPMYELRQVYYYPYDNACTSYALADKEGAQLEGFKGEPDKYGVYKSEPTEGYEVGLQQLVSEWDKLEDARLVWETMTRLSGDKVETCFDSYLEMTPEDAAKSEGCDLGNFSEGCTGVLMCPATNWIIERHGRAVSGYKYLTYADNTGSGFVSLSQAITWIKNYYLCVFY